MRRDRVAVLGAGGLFQNSLVEALASHRWFLVRRFPLDDPEATVERVNAFGPQVVLVVRSTDAPVPPAALSLMERGIPIITLDPKEPAMTFSFQERNTSATLGRVLEALRAACTLSSGRAHSATTSRGKRTGEGGGA